MCARSALEGIPRRQYKRGVEPSLPPGPRVATAPLAEAWHLALRVAFLTSLVAAATGVILYRLVGLSAWVIVPILAFGGWVVGCHLPPACPATSGARPVRGLVRGPGRLTGPAA